jgi:hypothetical protein
VGPRVQPGEDAASAELRFWLENMVVHHGYSAEEVAAATGREPGEVEGLLDDFGLLGSRGAAVAPASTARIKVLPYPGGRHPRIGFLEGAIDPHRDTKASIFLPWEGAGYVVVDLPEALWWNRGGQRELLYLAHTHIPTHWDKAGVRLERIDWTRRLNGELTSRRRLPNGVELSARVVPRAEHVDMELALKNTTPETLRGLRTQVCVMLKGAPGFNEQTGDNKLTDGRVIAVHSRDRRRWIVTVWDEAAPWQNPPVPCLHSDPSFPDLAPGEEAAVRGRLFFFEGEDVRAEIARRRSDGTLEWRGGEEG